MVINQNLKEKIRIENSLNAIGVNPNYESGNKMFNEQKDNINNKNINSHKKNELMSKNISKALEYYNIAES
jgi:hypothetical protein